MSEYNFSCDSKSWTYRDSIIVSALALIVLFSNALYVSDLYMLWHDDNQSFYSASNFYLLNRTEGAVSRHYLVDNFFLQIMANTSPFVARVLVIIFAGIPLCLMAYAVYRLAFGMRSEAAAFAAVGPVICAGQWEVFVGVNLSYVVFDAAFFFASVLAFIAAQRANRLEVSVLTAMFAAFIVSDGMASSLLLGPALIWAALFIRPRSWVQTGLILFGIGATLIKVGLEQSGQGRVVVADSFLASFLAHFATSVDQLLPGGMVLAWLGLLVLVVFAAGGVYLALGHKFQGLLLPIGFAAALYVIPVLIYIFFRPGFPNRYGFLPAIGVFLAVGLLLHLLLECVERFWKFRPISIRNLSLDFPMGRVLSMAIAGSILLIGFHKSQYVAPIFSLISDRTRIVMDYFHPHSDPIAGALQRRTDQQLIVLSESGFPYMYPHRLPALGYLRYVTGNDRAVGFAGSRKLCAAPFEPWEGAWLTGPGGFSEELPISIHAFAGENGRGTPLTHLLSTPASSLEQEGATWSLYAIGETGAELQVEGEGREALEQALVERSLEPRQLAFSCGL